MNKEREKQIQQLKEQLAALEAQLTTEELLEKIWMELGPYTPHLSNELRYKLQDHFGFDDSE